MTTLKTKHICKQLEQNVLNESRANKLLIEAINDDLLRKFNDALNKGEELEDLLGSLDIKIFLKILKQINLLVKNDLRKSTEFFGGDKLLRNKIKKWFQTIWKNSVLERQEKFIEDFDKSLQQIVKHLDTILPKHRMQKHRSINSIPDIDQHERKIIYDMIIQACSFSDPDERINQAIQELASKLFDLGIEQIDLFSNLVSQIKTSVASDVQTIDNVEQQIIQQDDTNTQQEKPTNENDKLDIENVINTFVGLDKNTFNAIMRAINAKRKLKTINL